AMRAARAPATRVLAVLAPKVTRTLPTADPAAVAQVAEVRPVALGVHDQRLWAVVLGERRRGGHVMKIDRPRDSSLPRVSTPDRGALLWGAAPSMDWSLPLLS